MSIRSTIIHTPIGPTFDSTSNVGCVILGEVPFSGRSSTRVLVVRSIRIAVEQGLPELLYMRTYDSGLMFLNSKNLSFLKHITDILEEYNKGHHNHDH